MNGIYIPTAGADDWRWLLASPGLHWKHGASAMALAHAWERADGWPSAVRDALSTNDELADIELLLGLPEHLVSLPGGATASQTDLFILARRPTGELVTIAVEGKAAEPFGDHTVRDWRDGASPGKTERLAHLLSVLGLADDARIGDIRYQLLHRTASAVIEARRFGARHTVVLVHSFSPTHAWFDDYKRFAALYDTTPEDGQLAPVADLGDVRLHLGWVSDSVTEPDAQQHLGPRFDRALALARELHGEQTRKGTEIPYTSHLLAVASLVLEDGGDEDEAIAALLHDAVEDQGGPKTAGLIRQRFGRHVADIVQACSDTDEHPKPPWRARKEAYLAHLRDPGLPDGTLRVSLADKVHNARAILCDLHAGHDVFSRFSAPREETLWYYNALADTFCELAHGPLARELRRVVDALARAEEA